MKRSLKKISGFGEGAAVESVCGYVIVGVCAAGRFAPVVNLLRAFFFGRRRWMNIPGFRDFERVTI